MQFTRLRLAGFKSFVEPTELLIEPGLTGIVGPNGCGKSNLVEALRWVMGESSARGLRGGEMDDVIFAGTRGRASFDLAEVVIQLRTAGHHVPGLGDVEDLELARRIGRGAGSSFRLNGREVRARDVQLLFADAASGARSAAIVSQGQIGALVEAKPAERRRLLEDAAGIAGLQARRHEAELKLQATEANLARVEDLIGELGEQHGRLKKQARQAIRYRELSAGCREALAAVLTERFAAARARQDALASDLALEDEGVRAIDEAIAQTRVERDARGAALEAARTAVAEAGAEHARLAERLAAAEREAAREAERRADLDARVAETGLDLAAAERELADAREMLERLTAEQREVEEAIREDDSRLEATLETVDRAQVESEVAEASFRERLAETTALETELRHQRTLLTEAAESRTRLTAEADRVARALADLPEPPTTEANGVQAAEQTLEASLAASEMAQENLAGAEQRVEEAAAALAVVEGQVAELTGQLRAQEAAVAQIESEQSRLGERLADLDERLERLAGRALRHANRTREREAAASALGVERRRAEAQSAQSRLEASHEARATALDHLAAAEAEEARLAADLGRLRQQLQTGSAERRTLDELAPGGAGFPPVLDRIVIDEGFADALAAALGDELMASLEPDAPSRWSGAAPAPDGPAPPLGATPLIDHVRAPAALANRLAQVGVVADDESGEQLAPALLQGQRLVSRAGALWRWDGFRRRPEGAAQAAVRLRQAQRRQALDQELESLETATAALQAELTAAAAEAEVRRGAAGEATLTCDRGREASEAAARALVQAEAAASSLAAEIESLRLDAASLEEERSELSAERARVGNEAQALGDPPGDDPGLRSTLSAAQRACETAAEAHAGALETRSAARHVADEARRNVAQAQTALAAAREAARRAAESRRQQAETHARLEVEASRLAELLQASDAGETAAQTAIARLEPALAAARDALPASETEAGRARRQLADASAERTRLEDRQRARHARRATLTDELEAWAGRLGERAARQDELRCRSAALQAEIGPLETEPHDQVAAEQRLRTALSVVESRLAELDTERLAAEAGLAAAEASLGASERSRGERREAIARHEAELEAAEESFETARRGLVERELAEPTADHPVPDRARLEHLEAALGRAEAARERLGPVNLRAVDEAAETEMRLQTLTTERDELLAAIERLRRGIATLNREGRERLRLAFAAIEQHFEALFVRLFGGGEARLALTDLEDPLAAGLEVMASPPGKKLQSLSLLSGGEKALTALALVFAVFLTRPSPLCILDEVDAPLDDANVERLAHLLEEMAGGTATRFVVVTHHPLTMAHMDRLYGVTMLERGVSRLVSVDLRAAEELRATA